MYVFDMKCTILNIQTTEQNSKKKEKNKDIMNNSKFSSKLIEEWFTMLTLNSYL